MNKFCLNSYSKILIPLVLSFQLISCKDETEELIINDYLYYYNEEVEFSGHAFSEIDDNTAVIYTTVSIPSDLTINDYGHCWIKVYGDPTISDTKTSFGNTNQNIFTISSTLKIYSPWTRYYIRAYIITNEGLIYDQTYTSYK